MVAATLARHDKMFMSASIEGRPPFLTKKLAEKRLLCMMMIFIQISWEKNIKEIALNIIPDLHIVQKSDFLLHMEIGYLMKKFGEDILKI